jgi:hypothetical protein
MGERTFDVASLVTLPRLNANGAIALGREISTAVKKAGPLPGPLKKPAALVAAASKGLRTIAANRLLDPANQDTEAGRKADVVVDAAWRATHDWATGWAELPLPENAKLAKKAEKLLVVLFTDGLKFIQLPYKLEHSESQARLDRIEEDSLGDVFDALGGTVFLTTLQKAHKAYGKALGLTESKRPKASTPDVRAAMDEFYAALRLYVVRVSASADEDDPGSAERAAALLAPIEDAESLGRGPAAAADAPAPDAPEAPAAASPAK